MEKVKAESRPDGNQEEPKKYDPWQDYRQVYIPLVRGDKKTQEVGVNDKTYFVPKGKFVDVPLPVAEVVNEMLERQRIMEEEADRDPLAMTPENFINM